MDEIERRLDRRLRCDERVAFDTPAKERLGGVLKNLSPGGGLLLSMERIGIDTELVLYLTLTIGGESMELGVTGRVLRVEKGPTPSLRGYAVRFNETNPEAVNAALRDVVSGKDSVLLGRKEAPAKTEQENKPKPPKEPVSDETAPEPPTSPEKKEKLSVSELYDLAARDREKLPARSSGRSYQALAVLAAVTLLGAAGAAGFRMLKTDAARGSVAKYSSVVPLKSVRADQRDVTALVDAAWLEKTPPETRVQKIEELGRLLASENIESLSIQGPGGRDIAVILISHGGSRREVNVRFF